MADPTVAALYRYPVKGLSPERMRETALTVGEAVPFDRAYAIENGPGPFDAAAPRHLPKITFLCLMRDERLARMQTSFDCATHTLVITQNGAVVARGDLRTRDGRAVIESFMTREMAAELRGDPRVVSAPGHCFSDVREKCLHIVMKNNHAGQSLIERPVTRQRLFDGLQVLPGAVIHLDFFE